MYTHGGNVYKETIEYDFSVNLNPLGIPKAIMESLTNSLSMVQNYPNPSCDALKETIAKYEGIPAETIICGNGASELIYGIVQACKPQKALLIAPCFSEYERALKSVECELDYDYLAEATGFAMNEQWVSHFLTRISQGYDMIFLTNPNNPTGTVIKKQYLEQIVKELAHYNTVLVLDESFIDFIQEDSYVGCLKESARVFVLKSMTKIFSIPGIRLGYGICYQRELLAKMEQLRQCWPISVPAQNAGIAAFSDEISFFMEKTRDYVKEERLFLENGMKDLAKETIEIVDGEGNFILFRLVEDIDLYKKMLEKRILIRKCDNFRGLSANYYRIAVKTHEENEHFLRAMKEIING